MFFQRWLYSLLGVLWGALLCLPLLLAACFNPGSKLSAKVLDWEKKRQARGFGIVLDTPNPPRRGFYACSGLIAGFLSWPVIVMVYGFVLVTLGALVQTLIGGGSVIIGFDVWTFTQPSFLVGVLYGAANLIGAIILAEVANWLHGKIDEAFVEVSRPNAPQTRISELLMTRQGVVMAIDDERRRIERDLHDGVQQNVVSLSVLIARAGRAQDPAKVRELLDVALAQSQDLIDEMREVAWRVYPTALDERGLGTVLERLADHCPVPIEITAVPAARFAPQVESAAYFVIREAVTNVVKHAVASHIRITVSVDEVQKILLAEVTDDGRGGADVRGGGLQGLSRRVGALDGRLSIESTPNVGTTVRAEIPYA